MSITLKFLIKSHWESLVPRPLFRKKPTLITEPLVTSVLAHFMYEKLPSPEIVSWEQFDYFKKVFTHALFAKTSSATICLLHSLKSLLML